MRAVSILACLLVIAVVCLSTWFNPASGDLAAVGERDLKLLREATPEQWSEHLSALESKLLNAHPGTQLRLLQTVPADAPLVLAVPLDSSDEEQPTGWQLEVPEVQQSLTQTLTAPQVVPGWRGDFAYAHHLYPLEPERALVLLWSVASPRANPWGWRMVVVMLAVLTLVGLLAGGATRASEKPRKSSVSQRTASRSVKPLPVGRR